MVEYETSDDERKTTQISNTMILNLPMEIWGVICKNCLTENLQCFGLSIYYILFQVSKDFNIYFKSILYKTRGPFDYGNPCLRPLSFLEYISTYDLDEFLQQAIVFLVPHFNKNHQEQKKLKIFKGYIEGLDENVYPHGIIKFAYQDLICSCYRKAASRNAVKILFSLEEKLMEPHYKKTYYLMANKNIASGAVESGNTNLLRSAIENLCKTINGGSPSYSWFKKYIECIIKEIIQIRNLDLFKWIISNTGIGSILLKIGVDFRYVISLSFEFSFIHGAPNILEYIWNNYFNEPSSSITSDGAKQLINQIQNFRTIADFFRNYEDSNWKKSLQLIIEIHKSRKWDIDKTPYFLIENIEMEVFQNFLQEAIVHDNLDGYEVLSPIHEATIDNRNFVEVFDSNSILNYKEFISECIKREAVNILSYFIKQPCRTKFSLFKINDARVKLRDISTNMAIWIMENDSFFKKIPDFVKEIACRLPDEKGE
jgi:hypothetical protein